MPSLCNFKKPVSSDLFGVAVRYGYCELDVF